jgi:hypothetical protein
MGLAPNSVGEKHFCNEGNRIKGKSKMLSLLPSDAGARVRRDGRHLGVPENLGYRDLPHTQRATLVCEETSVSVVHDRLVTSRNRVSTYVANGLFSMRLSIWLVKGIKGLLGSLCMTQVYYD